MHFFRPNGWIDLLMPLNCAVYNETCETRMYKSKKIKNSLKYMALHLNTKGLVLLYLFNNMKEKFLTRRF